MFVSSTYRITKLHYTYGNTTLSEDYVGYLYFENYWLTPHIWVSNLKGSLCWSALPTELLGYITLIGVQPQVQPTLLGVPPTVQLMFVSSTYRITGLHYTYGSATLSAAYVGYLYVENHRVTLQLLVRHLK